MEPLCASSTRNKEGRQIISQESSGRGEVHMVEISDTIPEIVVRFQKTIREWRSFTRHHAQEERRTFIERLAIAQAEAEPNPKITTNKKLKQLKPQEEQRRTSRNVKFALGGSQSAASPWSNTKTQQAPYWKPAI
jgi:hypothetical protein